MAKDVKIHLPCHHPTHFTSQLIERHISNCFMYDRCMYFDYGADEVGPRPLPRFAPQLPRAVPCSWDNCQWVQGPSA
jgi:hypothetical protein